MCLYGHAAHRAHTRRHCVQLSAFCACLLWAWCSAVVVDDAMIISDPSGDNQAIQVQTEDVLRAFGEEHKTQYRLSDTPLSRKGQQEIWAAIVCELYQFDLLYVSNIVESSDATIQLDQCLELAAQIYVAVLGRGGSESTPSWGALAVIAESRELLKAEWTGTTFDVDSHFRTRIRLACKQQPVFKVPGTSWVVDTRGAQWIDQEEEELILKHCLPVCLFTTRWCPMHPEVSGKIVQNTLGLRNITHHQHHDWCLAQADKYWRWCGELDEAPLSMIFMHDSLANASWSTYPEGMKDWDGGMGDRRVKMVGSYDSENNGWRQLHAWVADQELLVAPPPVQPLEADLVTALRNWRALMPDSSTHDTFNVKTAEAVIAHVYREQQAKWWTNTGAGAVASKWHAEILQDWWVVTLFDGMKGGYFVELAAYDAVAYSNSYVLERDYGWRGICVEPQANHWKGLLHRKCVAVAAVVGDETGGTVEFDSRQGNGVAGVVSDDTPNRVGHGGGSELGGEAPERVTYRTITIRKIFEDLDAPRVIHYLSLDVEGSEHLILQTFPFDTNRVLVITIERPNLCARTILRQQGFLYLRDLSAQDEIWVHPTLPNLVGILERYGKREPKRDDFLPLSKDTGARCRQMAKALARGLMQGCCRPELPLPNGGEQ